MTSLVPGMRLQQRYILRGRIGRGGMSDVWHAHDEVLRRDVAVKALAPALAADPPLRAAISAEARAVAQLNHPHITQMYDHGEVVTVDGTLVSYLVMELVGGRTLAARLALGPLPWPEASRLVGQVAAALAEAHRAGLVHRDIKPANVMLAPIGAKVLDFGIAAAVGSATPGGTARIGTPAYAAPERLASGPAEPASDMYSLGALFYEALTGRPPVIARTWAEAAQAHRMGAPLPRPIEVPGLPPRLAALCLACLSPDPERRPPARAVAAALGVRPPAAARVRRLRRTLVERHPTVATPAAAIPAVDRPRRWRVLPVVGLAAAVVAGALAVAVLSASLLGSSLLDGQATARDAAAAPPRTATTAGTASSTSAPSTSSTSAPTPSASPDPVTGGQPPATPRTVLVEFERLLAAAAAAGRVRDDVALDLRNALVELRLRIERGQPGELRLTATQLRHKLEVRLAEQAIDGATAARLATVLEPLLSA